MDNNTIFILTGLLIIAIFIFIVITRTLIKQNQKKLKNRLNLAIDIGQIEILDNKKKFLTVDKLFNLLQKITKEAS